MRFCCVCAALVEGDGVEVAVVEALGVITGLAAGMAGVSVAEEDIGGGWNGWRNGKGGKRGCRDPVDKRNVSSSSRRSRASRHQARGDGWMNSRKNDTKSVRGWTRSDDQTMGVSVWTRWMGENRKGV